jgi:hypothetical protein
MSAAAPIETMTANKRGFTALAVTMSIKAAHDSSRSALGQDNHNNSENQERRRDRPWQPRGLHCGEQRMEAHPEGDGC